jgi:alginate O-acetyltransferase complex protein AlgI
MLLALLGVLVAAPIFWFVVPAAARKNYLAAASLVALGLYDPRLPFVLVALVALLYAAIRMIANREGPGSRRALFLAFAGLLVLFGYNKVASPDRSLTVVATQGGLVFLGISYFVLKAVAILVDVQRGAVAAPGFVNLLRWMVFVPIYPSGPIEEFRHFDTQEPSVDREQILIGLQRILFGCVRGLLIARLLADWSAPIIAEPEAHSQLVLLAAAYAFTLRFYFDFAGYSDIAIGLAAVYGYRIQENFDNPLIQRNLGLLWQHWHMTLTRWMRVYLFTPLSRAIMRKGGPRYDVLAIVGAQISTMMFCGMWHGLRWEFAVWGLCHALGLIWIGLGVRRAGSYLPGGLVSWWRRSPIGYGASCFLSVSAFSLINIIGASEFSDTVDYFSHLLGIR